RGWPAAVPSEVVTSPAQLPLEVFEPARDLDRPAEVTEVPPHFTHDRRYRERHKVATGIGIETVDRVHQSKAGDLVQVGVGFAAAAESTRDVAGERQCAFDDGLMLTPIGATALVKRPEGTDHFRDFCVCTVRLRHGATHFALLVRF